MAKRDGRLTDLLTMLPWGAGAVLAAAAYVLLEWLLPFLGLESPVARTLLAAVPPLALTAAFVLLIAGAFSVYNSRSRRTLLAQQEELDAIRALPWPKFEQLVGHAYSRRGYIVQRPSADGGVGGVDMVAERVGCIYLIQCKRWKDRTMGVDIVREMHEIMTARHANGMTIIITGTFTQPARAFAKDKPIDLVDGGELLSLLAGGDDFDPEGEDAAPPLDPAAPIMTQTQCPRCGAKMVLRTTRGGAHAGRQFWGCSAYPACKYTRSLRRGGGGPQDGTGWRRKS